MSNLHELASVLVRSPKELVLLAKTFALVKRPRLSRSFELPHLDFTAELNA